MATTYAEAQELLVGFLERDHDRVGELGRTIVLSHGTRTKRAAVLLHGMAASPTQFLDFAKMLHERGYNVLVPRLPRHGYTDRLTEALADLSAAQLKDVTTQALEIAHGLGESVIVVGFSLGGLLAAWAAQFHRVAKIICIAPFFGIAWMPHRFGSMLSALMLRFPNRFHWWNPIQREKQMPAHGYPRYSTHAVGQAYRLVYDVFHDAGAHAPRAAKIVVVMNSRETTINNRSARKLIELWRAQSEPDSISTFEFTDLPPSHDIIEPLRNPAIVSRVYPKLLELIEA
ncbi:MAG: alpha/beta hydrolase [Candidatus Baltobacteraceae bacterium]